MTLKKNITIPSGYTFVGHFHSATANAIGLTGGDIYISRNYITHIKKRHGHELQQLGFTPLEYVKSIFRCFNRIYGDRPERATAEQACSFVVYNPELSHVAVVEMNLAPKQGFWEVHTAHPIAIETINKKPLLYEKKNAEASFSLP